MSDEVVRLEAFRIRSRAGRVLLDDASLRVGRGERVCITGESGAGKSLLLSALMGRVPASLSAAGDRYADAQLRIGVVPQRGVDALHPLISIGRQLRVLGRVDADRRGELLRAVGLDQALLRRRPAELSGGQAQRAAIALAFSCRPAIVVADEPTSALDPQTRDDVLALFDRLVGTETALVVATHDPHVVAALDGRHVRVSSGRVDELTQAAA